MASLTAKDGVVSLGEAQAYVADRTLLVGQANVPAIFPEEDAQMFMTAHTLEQGPNDALVEQLSIQLRMKTMLILPPEYVHKPQRFGRMFWRMFKEVDQTERLPCSAICSAMSAPKSA